ncbi:MAG TPA: hypothetical protein VFI34_05830 [Candidatus Limnocylindrales bacterium]|nr:hypothetical protein [Candidatus Limnocylindrales bacterium]
MDESILQVGLVALFGAIVLTMYELRASLRPVACPECDHCRARAEADRAEQERLARDYAQRMNLPHDEDGPDRL